MNERLKTIRKFLSLSQESFGNRLGVTGTAISRIEIGNRAVTEQMVIEKNKYPYAYRQHHIYPYPLYK